MVTDRARKPPTTPNQASISKQTVMRTPPPLTAKNNPVKTHQNTIQRSSPSVTSTPSPSNVVSKSNTILVNTVHYILLILRITLKVYKS